MHQSNIYCQEFTNVGSSIYLQTQLKIIQNGNPKPKMFFAEMFIKNRRLHFKSKSPIRYPNVQSPMIFRYIIVYGAHMI